MRKKSFFTIAMISVLAAVLALSASAVTAEGEEPAWPVLGEGEFAIRITLDGQPVTSIEYGTISIGSRSAKRQENDAYVFNQLDPKFNYSLITGGFFPNLDIGKKLESGNPFIEVAFITAELPQAATGLVYNGKEQLGLTGGSHYKLYTDPDEGESVDRAVDAGDYTACVVPEDDSCVWAMNDFGVKKVSWTIQPNREKPVPDDDKPVPDIPKTGDRSNPVLWLVILCAAGAGILLRRRRAR